MISKACLGAGRIDLSRTSSYQSYLGISNQHIESNQTKSCPTILGHIYSDLVISIIISLHSYLQKTYFRTAYDAIAYILSGVWIFVEAGHHKQTNKQGQDNTGWCPIRAMFESFLEDGLMCHGKHKGCLPLMLPHNLVNYSWP